MTRHQIDLLAVTERADCMGESGECPGVQTKDLALDRADRNLHRKVYGTRPGACRKHDVIGRDLFGGAQPDAGGPVIIGCDGLDLAGGESDAGSGGCVDQSAPEHAVVAADVGLDEQRRADTR